MRVDMELGNGKTGASIIDPVKHEDDDAHARTKMYMVMKMPESEENRRGGKRPRTMWSLFAQEKPTPFSVTNARRSSSKARMAKRRSWGGRSLGMFQSMGGHGRWGGRSEKRLGGFAGRAWILSVADGEPRQVRQGADAHGGGRD